jgi:tRNA (guanine37-N1)-methyltransferase
MRFTVVTILPELIEPSLTAGVVGRAREAGVITVDTVNPRDFTRDRHRTVDDTPYGGGPGMVMKVEPLLAAIAKASEPRGAGGATTASASEVDVLGQPVDPLGKVESALANVESMIGAIATAVPLESTTSVSQTIAEADATLAAIEGAVSRPSSHAETRPVSMIDEDIDLALPPRTPVPSGAPASRSTSVRAKPHRILLSPSGTPLTQARVRELAKLDHLVLVCGRYEGVDQRVIDLAIDEELSIGDYVLSGGELGALVIVDAVSRLIPGVLGEPTSADDESFSAGLLEYPQYTRPHELVQIPPSLQSERTASPVPPVLQSGNHAAIHAWRRQQAMRRTAARRPDLWRHVRTTKADNKLFPPLCARTHLALVHHPIVDRLGAVVTSALTNFDIHDLARSSMTYGLAGYHIVTPITSQREKAEHIASLWMASEQGEHRATALRLIRTAESVEAVIAELTAEYGQAPLVVATSAKSESFPAAARRTSSELLAEACVAPAPMLILLGTGWGLADHLIPSVSRVLAPIEGASEWNHLSVRSAGAVILDRLFGRPA